MKDVSEVTCMCVDSGMFLPLARVLGRTMKKVYYCNPSAKWLPKMNVTMIGEGYPELEICFDIHDHEDKVDLYVFFDVGYGATQCHLEKCGKAVWGSRMVEDLEFERSRCKWLMETLGMAVGPYDIVKGMDDLRDYLRKHDDVYIKMSRFRGQFETFSAPNYAFIEPLLDKIEKDLGGFKNKATFCVEQPLKDKFEGGVDSYNIDGQLPKNVLCGREIKDECFVGKITEYDRIPKPITEFDRVFAPVFRNYGYRGFYSTEVRVGKDGIPYMLDLCARCGSPPSELYSCLFTNLADIVWQGANGICIEPEPLAKWGTQIFIYSSWAEKNWQNIQVPEEYLDNVKLAFSSCVDGQMYCMPQPETDGPVVVGSVIGYGSSMQDSIDMAKEIAEEVKGYYLDIKCDAVDEAEKELEEAVKMGVFPE